MKVDRTADVMTILITMKETIAGKITSKLH